ncbi:MAG TPA: 6-phosphogluconolactonase [Dinghuibacter sp.]|uniref:6-phosphogluconolactonase n=1 Tax=Dinghuibacter sp. TaxID=2024697 RepID=UPI002CE5A25D|nr:6-phosphogluconolactonase [Dinghuibacter sp.]HTJ14750.1 6-phosphogluconolactonase [Dinghuibacter sp.]
MEVHVYATPPEVSRQLAEWITAHIETTLKTSDRYTWCLTGGNSPKELYSLLAAEPFRSRIDWSRVHLFWGDERAVPFEDDRNNARMTFATLVDHVHVLNTHVHVMNTALIPEKAAEAYAAILHTYFTADGPTFDLVLNGMGEDGHTLSLFPGQPVIHEETAWVKAYYLEAQKMYRITLTAPLVNRAHRVAFLTFGANKAHALREVLKGERNVDLYPSQIIQPIDGELHWFVDAAAAEEL